MAQFESSGLGLTKAEWEQLHTFNSWDGSYIYDTRGGLYGGYSINFWHKTDDNTGQAPQDAPIYLIGADTRIILSNMGSIPPLRADKHSYYDRESWPSRDEMRTAVHSLLPNDAQLLETRDGLSEHVLFIEIYHSKFLQARYSPIESVGSIWGGEPPGTIFVTYSFNMPAVMIRAGSRYAPPADPPPTRTLESIVAPTELYEPPQPVQTPPEPLPTTLIKR